MGTVPVLLDLVYSVSNIVMVSNGQANNPCIVGKATGFFFQYEDDLYLITNRHVVVNEREHFYPDSLILNIHTSRDSNIPNQSITVNLYNEERESRWLEHPRQPHFNLVEVPNLIDVVAIPISGFVDVDLVNIRPITPEDIIPEGMVIEIGGDVFTICYPMGFYDTMHNLPIFKRGSLAIAYRQHFLGHRFFIIDTNLQNGTSGGPVFLHPTTPRVDQEGNILLYGFQPYLLGIHSAEYVVDGINLGLNIVWYPEIITEILQNRE